MSFKVVVRSLGTLSYVGSYKKFRDRPIKTYTAAILGAGYIAYTQHRDNQAQALSQATELLQLKNYMAEPVTPVEELEGKAVTMKAQMEIQAEFCRALEAEEDKVGQAIL